MSSSSLRTVLLGLAVSSTAPPAAAQRLQFYVDGERGSDVPQNGSSPAAAWKTITYAFTRITPPAVPDFHTLSVAGDQVYSPATNGEAFPIRPKANVNVVGAPGVARPVLQVPAGVAAIVFDPNTIYHRDESTIQNLVCRGGDFGLRIGGNRGFRHRPRVWHCDFVGQAQAGIRIDTTANNVDDPRFFDCRFTGTRGIWCTASGVSAMMRPDVDECVFEDLRVAGVFVNDTAGAGSDVGGLVRFSRFVRCGKGVHLVSAAGASGSRLDVLSCYFRDCVEDGIHVEAQRPVDPVFTAVSCSFVGGARGLRFDGALIQGAYVLEVRDNVAWGQSEHGFLYALDGAASVRLLSEGNLATSTSGNGFRIVVRGVQLTMDSTRDRAIGNAAQGMWISGGNLASSIHIHCGMFVNNGANGLDVSPGSTAVEVRWLTLADNRGYGLAGALSQASTAIDHCIFARNASGEVSVLPGTRIEYSAFETMSYAGTGNLQGDPGLVRPSYKIGRSSRCRDAGNASTRAPLFDYEGEPRVAPGALVPDIGADEYLPYGNAVPFGVPGFGSLSFHPVIASPGGPVQIGGSVQVELRDALDYFQFLAAAGVLVMGTSEDSSPYPFDLSVAGAHGSFLWQDLQSIVAVVPVGTGGRAQVNLPIPREMGLVGATVLFQWLVPKFGANAAHCVTTQGLRATIDL